jgi:uncharacterized Fe-S radical SAM superfamily protein PflX
MKLSYTPIAHVSTWHSCMDGSVVVRMITLAFVLILVEVRSSQLYGMLVRHLMIPLHYLSCITSPPYGMRDE